MHNENSISHIILDCAFKIHRSLGPGLLESVYHKVLLHELRKAGLLCGLHFAYISFHFYLLSLSRCIRHRWR